MKEEMVCNKDKEEEEVRRRKAGREQKKSAWKSLAKQGME